MPDFPKTFKAAVVKNKQQFEIEDRDLVMPGKGELLVKVLACGVCHSDSICYEEIMPVLPRVPGHEVIGEVVAVGSDTSFEVGQVVGGGWHGGHCGTCASCKSGDFVTCKKQAINGITRDGGYAEYCLLRDEATALIPEGMDPCEAAPLLCAGVTTFNSLRNMGATPGDIVAVQGIGGLGHLAVQYASKMGFEVVALSQSDSKRELATKLGAQHYVDGSKESQAEALAKMGGAKVIVCTAPSSHVIKDLINGLAVDGTLLILAISDDLSVPVLPLVQKRLSVRGWPSGTAKDSEETLAFTKAQGLKCAIEKFDLLDVEQAYESMISGKARFRAVLVPGFKK